MTKTCRPWRYRQSLVATLLLSVVSQTYGAGFALIEQSASGLGNAFAGAGASAQDASTIFFNPAGLMYLQDPQFVAAGHLIKPSTKFSGSATDPLGAAIDGGNGGDAGDLGFVPNVYYSRPLPNNFVFGLGINAPFGLKTEYNSDWVGRYHAIESEVKTVNINPAIAYRATPTLAVGVGVSVQYIEATLSQAANQFLACANALGAVPCLGLAGEPDIMAEVDGDDWSYGYNVGLMFDVAPTTRIGLAYRSKVDQELEGNATFTGANDIFNTIGILVPTDVKADVNLPETASLSLYHEINSEWTLLADATWTKWSRFQELRVKFDSNQPDSVTVEDWDDSMRFSLGANYRYNSAWLLRAGIAYDEEPIPDAEHRTPRIPGNDRKWLAVGANYRYSPALSFDVGYAHLFVNDTRINHTSATAGTITGTYDSDVDILSAQVNWNF